MSFEALCESKTWHSDDKLQKDLSDFHEACASFPHAAFKEAMKLHDDTMKTLRKDLQDMGVALVFEYTGSAYEGIKVPSSTMEFDVMVVLSGGENLDAREVRPCYYELYPTGPDIEPSFSKMMSTEPYQQCLLPTKVREYFTGKLQKAINLHEELRTTIRLKYHGPAIQMDVYKSPFIEEWNKFYSVDMVPSFGIPSLRPENPYGHEYYVAKPFKGERIKEDQIYEGEPRTTWRRSFSLEEKKLIKTIDKENHCLKQCIRILKVLRDNEPNLHPMSSYLIKTAGLSLRREYPDLDWKQKNLGQRFINILDYLADAFENNWLGHYYIRKVNLLADIKEHIHREIGNRLNELVRSETELCKALKRAEDRAQGHALFPFLHADASFPLGDQDQSSLMAFRDLEKEDDQEGPSAGALLAGGAIVAGAALLGLGLAGLFKSLSTDSDKPTDRSRRK